jgi:hypothetical protein
VHRTRWGPPKELSLPCAVVTAIVNSTAVASAPARLVIDVTLAKGATALYATLTSAAPGYFADNAFLLTATMSPLRIEFVPFQADITDGTEVATLLTTSLRVEHVALYANKVRGGFIQTTTASWRKGTGLLRGNVELHCTPVNLNDECSYSASVWTCMSNLGTTASSTRPCHEPTHHLGWQLAGGQT